jgi:hypothetical protein
MQVAARNGERWRNPGAARWPSRCLGLRANGGVGAMSIGLRTQPRHGQPAPPGRPGYHESRTDEV